MRFGNTPDINSDKYIYKDAFFYNTGIEDALAPAASTSSTFNIDGDSDFFATKLTVHAVSGGDATTYLASLLPEVNIIITDTTSGRSLMNEQVPLANLAGSAQLPFILPIMRLFVAKSTIKIDYYNVSDNATYSALQLTFCGVKAFLRAA